MKLHLPSSLRKALLACLAAFALPVSLPVTVGTGALISFLATQQAAAITLTTQATTYNGTTYSGKIYTISGTASFHQAMFTQLMPADGSTDIFGPFPGAIDNRDLRFNDEGQNTPNFDFWQNVWGNGTATSGVGSRHGQTLRFAKPAEGENITTFNFTFNPLHLGGIITAKEDVAEYVLNGDGAANNRTIEFQSSVAAGSVKFTLETNFRLTSNNDQSAVFHSDAVWAIASGKSLTIERYNVSTDDNKSITVSQLGTPGGAASVVDIARNLTIGAGGKLTVNKGVDFTVHGDISSTSMVVDGGKLTVKGNASDGGTLSVNNEGSAFIAAAGENVTLTASDGGTIEAGAIGSNSVVQANSGGTITLLTSPRDISSINITLGEDSHLIFHDEITVADSSSISMALNSKMSFMQNTTIGGEAQLTASGSRGEIHIDGFAAVSGALIVRRGGAITIDGGAEFKPGSTLTLDSSGGSITINGTVKLSATNSVQINRNTTLEFGGELDLVSGRLVLGGGTLIVRGGLDATAGGSIDYREGSSLTVDTTTGSRLNVKEDTFHRVSGSTPLDIILEGADFETGWRYQLFADGSAVTMDNVYFNSDNLARGVELELGEDGVVRVIGDKHSEEITWEGKGEGSTWKNGADGWITEDDDKRFHPMDSVTFTGSDIVTIEGNISVGSMLVQGSYEFSGGSISVYRDGEFTIDAEATASFDDVGISAPNIEVAENAALSISTSETSNVSAIGGLHLSSGATMTISGEGNKYFSDTNAEDSPNGVHIDADATLRVENVSNWLGYAQGEGTLELANGGMNEESEEGFRDDDNFNTLTDSCLGAIVRTHGLAKLRLADNTLLQINSDSMDKQVERFNSIMNVEVEAGSVFAWRVGNGEAGLGTEETTLTLAGAGTLQKDGETHTGALQVGVFSGEPNADTTYVLNSKVALAGDATVYVHDHELVFKNLYSGNGHTLTKTGAGTLALLDDFHTDAEDKLRGKIAVREGTLHLNYSDTEALAGYDIHIFSDNTQHATLVLDGGGNVSSYTIGALAGSGEIARGENVHSIELRISNSFEEAIDEVNVYRGALSPDVVMNVVGGYQAFDRSDVVGELTMKVSHGGTLDLENLLLAEGEGNALHLVAGTPYQVGTAEQEAEKGTPGTLKLNGYHSPDGTYLDITLDSGSSLQMTSASLTASGLETPDFVLTSYGSEADLRGLSASDGTRLVFSLYDGSTLRMENFTPAREATEEEEIEDTACEMADNVSIFITADNSTATLRQLRAGNGFSINTVRDTPPEQLPDDEETPGEEIPGEEITPDEELIPGDELRIAEAEEEMTTPDLTNGSVLNLSNMTLGDDAVITLSAEESTIILSGTRMAKDPRINLTLTNNSLADLSYIDLSAQCYVEIIALHSDTNLQGAMFDSIPPDVDDDNPYVGGALTMDVTGGTHTLTNISFGEAVSVSLVARERARLKLRNTKPATGLQLTIFGTSAVVEDLEVEFGSKVTAMDKVLNLAGQNIIRISSELSNSENRIFSDVNLNLMNGAKLSVDATDVLPDILSEIGKERTYYISEGDLTSWRDKLSFGSELALLNVTVSLNDDGSLTFRALEVAPDTIYLASRDNINGRLWNDFGGNIYDSTDEKVAVYIDRDTEINLRGKVMGIKEDGLVLKNLMGSKEGNLTVSGEGSGKAMVTISNNFSDVSITEMEQALKLNLDHEKITFGGNLTIDGADLQIRHRDGDTGQASADSTTLIKGVLKMSKGKLIMTSGKLELASGGNNLGSGGATFAGNDSQLVLNGDTRMGGDISVSGNGVLGDTGREEHILLNNPNATITLIGGTRVNAGVVIGNQFKVADDESEEEEQQPEIDLSGENGWLDADEYEELAKPPAKAPREPKLAGTLSTAAGELTMESGRIVQDETEEGSILRVESGSQLRNVVLNLESGSVLTIEPIGWQDAAEMPEEDAATDLLAGEAPLEELPPMEDADLTEDEEQEPQEPEMPEIESDWSLSGLTGEGKLASTAEHLGGIEICTDGGDKRFSGDLSEYQGTIVVVAGNNTQYFDGVKGGKNWNLTNAKGGSVELNLMGGKQPNSLTMGHLTLQSGSFTSILFNMEEGSHAYLNLQGLTIENGADVTIGQFEGTISLQGKDGEKISKLLGTINVENREESYVGDEVIWHLHGIRNAKLSNVYWSPNGDLHFEMEIDNTNLFAKYALTENAAVGAGLIWGIQNTYKLGGDLAAIDALLYSKLVKQENPSAEDIAEANRVMAAVAGSSTAVLGSAVSTDMERQLRNIRNRTTSLAYNGDTLEPLHSSVWLNAESSYHKQNADSTMPGFKTNGWGGTVGAHTQVTPTATLGLALTAMYNDLESVGAADSLKGDMDTYYLTGFAQIAHQAWRHTFVVSVSKAELDVNRTVNYGDGAYTTKGSTDGFTFGLLYEAGYTMPLNIDCSVCLQPVLNFAWRMGQLGAYTESGNTNAGLHVEEQTFNAITFGAGARLQAAFGSRLWNRTGLLEARALLKADVGDRQGESDVSLQNASLYRGKVKAAEIDAVGVELGAGITVPTGRRSEVFADFSAELRADYTNMNATVGYKISF